MAKNGIPNQGSGLDVQRLTFDNLTSIPRRNNILFLSDYLQEQHSYVKGYASEGLTMWNDMASESLAPQPSQAEASTALDVFLLGTPVLKPRAPAPVIERSSTILKTLDSSGNPALIGEDQTRRKCTTGNPTRTKERFPGLNASSFQAGRDVDTKSSSGNKEKPKKRKDERVGSDEEHLMRLQERRERKRLKRDIMESPARENVSEKENPARHTRKKSDKKGKTKSPSFALMHGFTATNVGKSRITLKPLLRNVGVFKKGKASYALKTGKLNSKKRIGQDVCFSEARFLGTAKARAIKNIDFTASSSSSSSSSDDDDAHQTVTVQAKKKGKEVEKTSGGSVDVEGSNCGDTADRMVSPTPAEDRHSYDPANSITWDIERESYAEESEPGCRQGKVVLTLPRTVLARGGDQEEVQAAIVETHDICADVSPNPDAIFIKTPDESLHPSHSASQVVLDKPKAHGTGNHFSKYFLSENISVKEADGQEREDSYEGRRSMPAPVLLRERKPNRSMFRQTPPSIEARLASPTLSQMVSLDLIDETPHLYDTFSLADVRSVFKDASMDLDNYGAIHGPHAPQPNFRPRSDEYINFEPHAMRHYMENPDFSIFSGSVLERDFDLPMDSCGMADECCHRNILDFAYEGGYDGVAISDHRYFNTGDTGYMTYEPASVNNVLLRVASKAPNLSMPSLDGSSEDDNCVCLSSPTKFDHFSQGRSLLYGLDHGHTRVSDAEAEVAKLLKQNHWLPHRL